MTGNQWFWAILCVYLTILAGWALYLAATYGFGNSKEKE